MPAYKPWTNPETGKQEMREVEQMTVCAPPASGYATYPGMPTVTDPMRGQSRDLAHTPWDEIVTE